MYVRVLDADVSIWKPGTYALAVLGRVVFRSFRPNFSAFTPSRLYTGNRIKVQVRGYD